MNTLQRIFNEKGTRKIAEVCGVSYESARKWRKAGRLPRTEFTGETSYATTIAAMEGVGDKETDIRQSGYHGNHCQPPATSEDRV